MHWLISLLIVVVSALLWRIRGGLRFWGHKAPLNKIWYAVFIGVLCFLKNKGIEISVNATISTYVAYQLNSWGLYIGRLCLGGEIGDERENPLIDEIIFPLHITIKGFIVTWLMNKHTWIHNRNYLRPLIIYFSKKITHSIIV